VQLTVMYYGMLYASETNLWLCICKIIKLVHTQATITYIYAANDRQVFYVGCVVLLFSSNLSHGAKIVSLLKEGRACNPSKILQHWEVAKTTT